MFDFYSPEFQGILAAIVYSAFGVATIACVLGVSCCIYKGCKNRTEFHEEYQGE